VTVRSVFRMIDRDVHCLKILYAHCRNLPVSDSTRYALGQIRWYENRDDVGLLSRKIIACEENTLKAPLPRRFGCFIERSKLRARRKLTNIVKNTAQSTAEMYANLKAALTGPSGRPPTYAIPTGGSRNGRNPPIFFPSSLIYNTVYNTNL